MFNPHRKLFVEVNWSLGDFIPLVLPLSLSLILSNSLSFSLFLYLLLSAVFLNFLSLYLSFFHSLFFFLLLSLLYYFPSKRNYLHFKRSEKQRLLFCTDKRRKIIAIEKNFLSFFSFLGLLVSLLTLQYNNKWQPNNVFKQR